MAAAIILGACLGLAYVLDRWRPAAVRLAEQLIATRRWALEQEHARDVAAAVERKTWKAADFALEERKVAILERDVAIREAAEQRLATVPPAAAARKPPPQIPADLQLRIGRWTDQWAQDAERRVILELYEDCGEKWDDVRKLLAARDARPEDDLTAIIP